MFREPVAEAEQVSVDGGKRVGDISCGVILVCGGDSRDNYFFVNIDATADGVGNLQTNHSRLKK